MAVPSTREEFKKYCLNNKYTKWYFSIIEKAEIRDWNKKNNSVYLEKHHILPKCIFKNNNIVFLTAKEHFICHLLLTKMLEGEFKGKMFFALHRLINGNNKIYCNNSLLYEHIKIQNKYYSSIRSKKWWNLLSKEEKSFMRSGNKNGRYNKEVSLETRIKISNSNKGKLSKENHPLWNKGHSKETKIKMSIDAKISGKSKGEKNPMFGKEGASKNKKWYHDPLNKTEKYFVEGQQPNNYIKGRL